jgi:membrane-associated phospholipid phosphatase
MTVERAAEEIASGDVGRASRSWLGVVTVAALLAFATDTLAVGRGGLLPFDLPVARFVQQVPWGPLAAAMDLTNAIAGYWQLALGVVAILLLALLDRRAGWLMAIGAGASLLDYVLKLTLARQRPAADLVHVLNPAAGFSYPSGHAVFSTWLSFMLAFSLAPMVRPRVRPALWALAALVTFVACLGRVWAGVHWPSDVLGGFLLAVGWSAFVLWIPERWLPQPSIRWLTFARLGSAR